MTTLYFGAEKEAAYGGWGTSRSGGRGPQVIVGLLVDRTGLPLQIGCWLHLAADSSGGARERGGLLRHFPVCCAASPSAAPLRRLQRHFGVNNAS